MPGPRIKSGNDVRAKSGAGIQEGKGAGARGNTTRGLTPAMPGGYLMTTEG